MENFWENDMAFRRNRGGGNSVVTSRVKGGA